MSVLDPRQLFNLGEGADCVDSRFLIFEHESRKIAMQVDSVESILSMSTGDEDDLLNIFFRQEQPKLDRAFERGVKITSKGDKGVVVMLSANEIVKRLIGALAA